MLCFLRNQHGIPDTQSPDQPQLPLKFIPGVNENLLFSL